MFSIKSEFCLVCIHYLPEVNSVYRKAMIQTYIFIVGEAELMPNHRVRLNHTTLTKILL